MWGSSTSSKNGQRAMAAASGDRRQALFAKFRAVAQERLQRLHAAVIPLGQPQLSTNLVTEILREIHTLKGEARMLALSSLNELAHAVEEILTPLKTRGNGLGPFEQERLRVGLDLCGSLLQLQDFGPGPFAADIQTFLLTVRAPLPVDGLAGRTAVTPAQDVASISSSGLSQASVEARPTQMAAATSPSSTSSSQPTVSGSSAVAAPLPPPQPDGQGSPERVRIETMRIPIRELVGLTDALGTLLLRHDEMDGYALDISRLQHSLTEVLDGLRSLEGRARNAGLVDETTLSDRTAALLREMNVTLTKLSDGFFDNRTRLTNLQDTVRTIRLQPVRSILEQLPQAVRSLGRQQGKRIEVVIESGGASVDTQILDVLDVALVHLVRNAVDHGIETAAGRIAAGKPEEALVRIVARSLGAQVEIVVSDDGQGVRCHQVLDAAVQRGFLDRAEADALDDAGILRLLFLPGLSTREEVTDVSGRGVGLDVVKAVVEGIGGSVTIRSRVGEGAEFRILVPVSLALTRVVVVQVPQGSFALPAAHVHSVVEVPTAALEKVGDGAAVDLGSTKVPVADLGGVLGFDASGAAGGSWKIIVIEHADRLYALRVQRVVGEREVVVRTLDPLVSSVKVVGGTAVLEGGRLLQVLHVPSLVHSFRAAGAEMVAREQAREVRRKRRVLIVDDSELTRDMLVDLAGRLGLEPLEAVDGFDALRVLQQTRPDLVLTDLDMPVLDGPALIERLREAPMWRELPVVVLSTRGSDQDKERAMRAGANAYLVKASFKPADLQRVLDVFLTQ